MTSPLENAVLHNKISKPDFSKKAGREFFALFLLESFKKLLEYDKQSKIPAFKSIKPDFFSRFASRLACSPKKRILIGISGESASGKTTICNTIKHSVGQFQLPVEILSADNYFRDISALIKKHGTFDNLLAAGYDVDSPDNFNLEQLYDDLFHLSEGFDVKIPQYLVNGTGISVPKAILKKSEKIIVVEGMASMHGRAADLLDIRMYVDIDSKIQEKRFIERAVSSRNQNEENARKQLAYVKEASKKYILPKKGNSDVIIDGAAPLEYFSQIIGCFHKICSSFN